MGAPSRENSSLRTCLDPDIVERIEILTPSPTLEPLHFSSNSTISIRVVPMLRSPRVTPGSCQ